MRTFLAGRMRMLAVSTAVSVAAVLAVNTAAAAPPAGVPAGGVPQLIQQDTAISEQLLEAIAKLQESVNALSAPEGNVRVTPPVFANATDENIGCDVVNISNAPRTVVIELRNAAGTVAQSSTATIAAGAVTVLNSTPIGLSYCRFTVTNGTRADIRGAFVIGALTRNILSVPAE